MRRLTCSVVVTLAIALLDSSTVFGGPSETLTIHPMQDTFSREMLPDGTYGTGGALHVSGATATNALGAMQGRADSWLRFDVAAVVAAFDGEFGAGNWTLDSVVLSLRETTNPTSTLFTRGAGSFGVTWIADDDWSQGPGAPDGPGMASGNQIGWAYGQSILSGSDRALGTFQNAFANTRQDFSLSLDAAFAADIHTGGIVSLRLDAASDTIGFTVNSVDNANAANRPQLIVTATPEPASAFLLLLPTIWLRRRRA